MGTKQDHQQQQNHSLPIQPSAQRDMSQPKSSISWLMEYCSKNNYKPPIFHSGPPSGPPHIPVFTCTAIIEMAYGDKVGQGQSNTKQSAKHEAAADLRRQLDQAQQSANRDKLLQSRYPVVNPIEQIQNETAPLPLAAVKLIDVPPSRSVAAPKPPVRVVTVKTPVAELYEHCQRKVLKSPEFRLIFESNSPGEPKFRFECTVELLDTLSSSTKLTGIGEAKNKQDARQKAAANLLLQLKNRRSGQLMILSSSLVDIANSDSSSGLKVSELNEYCHKYAISQPVCEITEGEGPDEGLFICKLAYISADGSTTKEAIAKNKSKRLAKQDASANLLEKLREEEKEMDSVEKMLKKITQNLNIHDQDQDEQSHQAEPPKLPRPTSDIQEYLRDNSDLDLLEFFHIISGKVDFKDIFHRVESNPSNHARLMKLEELFEFKVIGNELGLQHEKKTAHTFCIKYKSATIVFAQENGLRIYTDEIREEAAKKAYECLKILLSDKGQYSY